MSYKNLLTFLPRVEFAEVPTDLRIFLLKLKWYVYEYFKMACFDDADVAVFMPFTPVRMECTFNDVA